MFDFDKLCPLNVTPLMENNTFVLLQNSQTNQMEIFNIHYIVKSIGTPSNERFDYFSNLHEYKSYC